jgi:ribose/xylose/arabinose/galactoside ABC-type transport system permease subunit
MVTTTNDQVYSYILWRKVATFIRNNAAILLIYGLIVLVGGATAIFSENFRQFSNLVSLFRQSIVLGLIAIGQSVVVLTGGMDMSVAMTARIVTLIVATIFNAYSSDTIIFPMIILGLGVGALIGGFNGLLVTRTHANPFIVTFGVASALRGISLAISTTPIRGVPSGYLSIYDTRLWGVPVNVFVMILIWVLAYVFTTRTRTGRALFAVGGSERVARLSAIRVNKTLISTYVISGVFAAMAGLFLLARTGVGDPSAAEGMDFQSVVAVALGGISLYGGKGSILGTLGGVLLLGLLSNVFNIVQIDIYYQQFLLGLIVLIAVAAYRSPRSL